MCILQYDQINQEVSTSLYISITRHQQHVWHFYAHFRVSFFSTVAVNSFVVERAYVCVCIVYVFSSSLNNSLWTSFMRNNKKKNKKKPEEKLVVVICMDI